MKTKAERKRLDLLLVERGLAESRHKAQAMILAGEVEVDRQRAEKAGSLLPENAHIEVHSRLQKYASRGGLKLEGASARRKRFASTWAHQQAGSRIACCRAARRAFTPWM